MRPGSRRCAADAMGVDVTEIMPADVLSDAELALLRWYRKFSAADRLMVEQLMQRPPE
jgi:hypothetical protein